MKIISSPEQLQTEILKLKATGLKVGFVPTMGNLHQGHLSLIETAKSNADICVCSIFVNPLQFGPNEDFDSYPRTLDKDIESLKALKVDYLFTPTNEMIYPQGKSVHTSVEANRLTNKLCGASRPTHFKGVTTVVNILFNIVQPDIAVFGKKDYQQYQIIKAMVQDLKIPIKIIGAEIVREASGLALSSRNNFLTVDEKKRALTLHQVIKKTANDINIDTTDNLINAAKAKLEKEGFKVDYFEIVSQHTLETATSKDQDLLIAAAAWLGQPRLIDNLEITR